MSSNIFKSLVSALILTIFTLFASASSYAFVEMMENAPLLKGTKIIAGDPDKNEFYIVAANDEERLRQVLKQTEVKQRHRAANSPQTKIEIALNKALEDAFSHQPLGHPNTLHDATHKKMITATHVALHSEHPQQKKTDRS